MSHFAQVINGVVVNVIVAEQEDIDTLPNKEQWIQTSYTGRIRKNYAGIGYTYDPVLDEFNFPAEETNPPVVEEVVTPEPADEGAA